VKQLIEMDFIPYLVRADEHYSKNEYDQARSLYKKIYRRSKRRYGADGYVTRYAAEHMQKCSETLRASFLRYFASYGMTVTYVGHKNK